MLWHTLSRWVCAVAGARRCTLGSAQMAQWLLLRPDRVRAHADAGNLVDELTSAVHLARHTIDRPNDRRLFLGPCGVGGCRQDVYGLPWNTTAACPTCGAEFEVRARQDWLLRELREWMGTAVEIARALRVCGVQVSDAMIRGYVRRKRLSAAATNKAGQPLYRVSDALDAAGRRYERLPVGG